MCVSIYIYFCLIYAVYIYIYIYIPIHIYLYIYTHTYIYIGAATRRGLSSRTGGATNSKRLHTTTKNYRPTELKETPHSNKFKETTQHKPELNNHIATNSKKLHNTNSKNHRPTEGVR